MRIAVIGTGVVGSYFGGILSIAGHEVIFCSRGESFKRIQESGGLTLSGPRGNWKADNCQVTTSVAEAVMADIVLSGVKLYDVGESSSQWREVIRSAGAVISLQNGLSGPDLIRSAVPGANVYGGMAFVAGHMESPGHLRYMSEMSALTFGGSGASDDPFLMDFHAACNDSASPISLKAHLVEDIQSEQWKKLVGLATNAALTCLTRKPAGVVYHSNNLLGLAKQAICEVVTVARAVGADLPGDIEANTLAMLQSFPFEMVASMCTDLKAGRKLELDGILGEIVSSGRRLGVPTPFFELAYVCLEPHIFGDKSE